MSLLRIQKTIARTNKESSNLMGPTLCSASLNSNAFIQQYFLGDVCVTGYNTMHNACTTWEKGILIPHDIF